MHDIRLAFRQLRATPIVTLVAVLSLALGIGANTAMFSLVDSLVLRALPVRDPGRLAIIIAPDFRLTFRFLRAAPIASFVLTLRPRCD